MVVDAGLTVPSVSTAFGAFQDMPPVFATAFMVGFVEATCIEALRPYLAAGQHTVGIHVDLSHSTATPIGMTVTADVELIAVEGRRLRFKIECRDQTEAIGSGFHERAILDAAKFHARVEGKRRQS
ncbi:MAG: thioesterase family protein [Betaproteobacteria bacterium]